MRIGEIARRAGVNVETLRYYERRGLLDEPPRGINGHRDYDEETVRFVKAVKEAQRLGFTLEEIAEHARLTSVGRAHETVRTRVAQKLDEIDQRIASLRRVREELERVVGCACDSLDHCTCGAAFLARGGRDPRLGPLIHVTNGESAGNTLRQTTLGGAVLSWQDVLHEGPVPALPPAELRAVRARFLSECGWGSERSLLESLERRDRLFEHALEADTSVVLWFENDLYDQLQLLQALTLAGDSPLELIQADSDLGPLQPEELEALWPLRRPVTLHTRALAREAWDAFQLPTRPALRRCSSATPPHCPTSTVRCAGCSKSCRTPSAAYPEPNGSCSSHCWTAHVGLASSTWRARRARRRSSSATRGRGSCWRSSCRSSRSCRRQRRWATRASSCPHA